jgi:hypothetical protein
MGKRLVVFAFLFFFFLLFFFFFFFLKTFFALLLFAVPQFTCSLLLRALKSLQRISSVFRQLCVVEAEYGKKVLNNTNYKKDGTVQIDDVSHDCGKKATHAAFACGEGVGQDFFCFLLFCFLSFSFFSSLLL